MILSYIFRVGKDTFIASEGKKKRHFLVKMTHKQSYFIFYLGARAGYPFYAIALSAHSGNVVRRAHFDRLRPQPLWQPWLFCAIPILGACGASQCIVRLLGLHIGIRSIIFFTLQQKHKYRVI